MIILLIIWFLFILVYMAFNVYGLARVYKTRIKGDVAHLAVLLYLISIFIVVAASLIIISRLDWGTGLNFRLPQR